MTKRIKVKVKRTVPKGTYIDYDKLIKEIRLAASRSSLGETTWCDMSAREVISIIAEQPKIEIK